MTKSKPHDILDMTTELTTAQLIERLEVEDGCIEAMIFNGAIRCTHFLSYDAEEGVLYDEGIDGETREISLEEFAKDYPKTLWRVWNDK